MKKINSLILIALFVFCFTATAFAAESKTTISVGEINSDESDDISVPIMIEGNTGICGSILYVTCDDGLTVKAINTGDALQSLKMTKPGDLSVMPIKILWDGIEEDTTNGQLFTLIFDKPVNDGKYEIKLSYNQSDVFNGELEPVDLELKDGFIRIRNGKVDNSEEAKTDIVTVLMTIKRRTANVTFDPKGANETTFYTMNRTGTKAVLNKKLTKRGYTFKDWRLANNKKITTILEKHLKTDITLTARFVPNNYYVYYKVTKPDRGVKVKGKVKTTKVPYTSEKFIIKGTELSAKNYVLEGWSTTKYGTEVMYEVGEEVLIDDMLPERGKKIYLYPVWKALEPEVN